MQLPIKIKEDIKGYLEGKAMYVKRHTINIEMEEYTEKQIALALREMRKKKIIKYGLRRWGLDKNGTKA